MIKHRDRRKKGAPIRVCTCGRKKENRGPKERQLTSAVGDVAFTRRYWKCTCGTDGAYAAATGFVNGDSYATMGFSTRTSIIDLRSGKVLFGLEKLVVRRNGKVTFLQKSA